MARHRGEPENKHHRHSNNSRRGSQPNNPLFRQQWWFTNLVQVLSLISGILTVLVGIVHAGSRVEEWCEPAETVSCIGSTLFWSDEDFIVVSIVSCG
jgi:hypothetical protein